MQIDYVFEAFSNATINLGFLASWGLENKKIAAPGEPGIDCLGLFSIPCSSFNKFIQPETKYVFNAGYYSGDFSGGFQWRHLSEVKLVPGLDRPIKSGDAANYVDLTASYTFNDQYTLFAGIDNLTDEEPPIFGFSIAGDANVDISLYDVLGRRFNAGFRIRY
jgi:outer membrane receptor protein involved in Fe transport